MNQMTDAICTSKVTALINAALSLTGYMKVVETVVEVPGTTARVYVVVCDTEMIAKLVPGCTERSGGSVPKTVRSARRDASTCAPPRRRPEPFIPAA
jgi:hypothetical protein